MYEFTGDAPWLSLGCHDNETLVSVTRWTEGRRGAAGNVEASGMRWKTTDGLDGCLTWRRDDHDDSPVSLTAKHVYVPLSPTLNSVNQQYTRMRTHSGHLRDTFRNYQYAEMLLKLNSKLSSPDVTKFNLVCRNTDCYRPKSITPVSPYSKSATSA